MRKLKRVEVVDDDVTITVQEASILAGARRFRLMSEGAKAMGAVDSSLTPPAGVDDDLFSLRVFTFPNFVTATVAVVGIEWPMSFEAFCIMPESLWDKWSAAVREVNPNWYTRNEGADPNVPTSTTSA